MALIACKDCKAEISTDAKACPQCGATNQAAYKGVRVAGLVYLGLIALAFYWFWGLFTPDAAQDVAKQPAAQVEEQPATVLAPQAFSNVSAMVEDFGDYSAENGSFTLVSSEPLHLQLAPTVVPGDLPENNVREVRRAALYGVYRTFIHTNAPAVKVTSVPNEVTFNPHASKILDKPGLVVTVTREQALQAVKQLIDVQQLSDLVLPEQAGTIQLDNWRKDFEAVYFGDEGQEALLNAIKASGGDLVNNG